MGELHYTYQAKQDLIELWVYVARDNPEAADRLFARIEGGCQLCTENPEAGRYRPELHQDLRSFPVAPYIIYYTPLPAGIRIIRILHEARDIKALFEDR